MELLGLFPVVWTGLSDAPRAWVTGTENSPGVLPTQAHSLGMLSSCRGQIMRVEGRWEPAWRPPFSLNSAHHLPDSGHCSQTLVSWHLGNMTKGGSTPLSGFHPRLGGSRKRSCRYIFFVCSLLLHISPTTFQKGIKE